MSDLNLTKYNESSIKKTNNRLGELETTGTETDGSFRVVVKSFYETSQPDVFEVITQSSAHNKETSTLMYAADVISRYDVYMGRDTRKNAGGTGGY